MKGFGHVEFDSPEAVQNALALKEPELNGRQLRIAVAETKEGGAAAAAASTSAPAPRAVPKPRGTIVARAAPAPRKVFQPRRAAAPAPAPARRGLPPAPRGFVRPKGTTMDPIEIAKKKGTMKGFQGKKMKFDE